MEEKLQERLRALIEAEARQWAELHALQGRIAEVKWIIGALVPEKEEDGNEEKDASEEG